MPEAGTVDHKPESRPLSSLSLLGMLSAVFMWGLSFPLLKIALDGVEPITLAVLRYAIGVIPLIIFLALRRDWDALLRPLKEDFGFFLCLGVFGVTLPNILQNYGMTLTSAHLSSVIQSSGPIFTILLAVFFLREPLGINKLFGTALALSGTLLLVTEGGLIFTGSTFIGNFLILMSAVSYSISSILGKKILEKYGPLTVATISIFLGTVLLAVFSLFESPAEKVAHISLYHWCIIVVLALLPGTLALLIWYKILRTTEVSRLILFIYLIPVFATAISIYWPGEELTPKTVLFAFLIVCGVMIAQHERSGKRKKRFVDKKPDENRSKIVLKYLNSRK